MSDRIVVSFEDDDQPPRPAAPPPTPPTPPAPPSQWGAGPWTPPTAPNSYGEQPYAQQPYGEQQYGQQQYDQQQYGQQEAWNQQQAWTEPPAPSRRTRKIGMVVAGVLLLGGLGVVATRSFMGSDAGASEPDGAVTELVSAIQNEDPVGMLTLISPTELEPWTRLSDRASGAASGEEDLAEQGFTIDPDDLIPGFQLEITSSEYSVELFTDDVAKVSFESFEGAWSFDADAFIDSGLVDWDQFDIDEDDVRDELSNEDGTFDLDDFEDLTDAEPFLMTVKEDGRWYLSPTYTVLEYVRELNGGADPDFDIGAGNGAPTPEESIEVMIEALASGDVDEIFDALPPTDAYRPYLAYREMLTDLADSSGETDVDLDISIDAVETTNNGGSVEVTVTEATFEWSDSWDERRYSVVLDDTCFEVTTTYNDGYEEQEEACLDDLYDELDGDVADAFAGIDRFWVVSTEVDGAYYVDPGATIGSWLSTVDLDALIEAAEDQANF